MNPILSDIDAFLAKTGMAATTLGKKAVNDGKAVQRLREGRRMWPETVQKLQDFMASYRSEAA